MKYRKIPYTDSQTLLNQFELSEPAMKKTLSPLPPYQVIGTLRDKKMYVDLVNYIAHGLPVRESIWWACQALAVRNGDWESEELKAIEECRRWVTEPDEHKRRVAEFHAGHLENSSAARWLAQAVFWNGQGSLAPQGEPVTLPPDYLYAKAVAGAINTAAVIPEWSSYDEYYQRVIDAGLDLANGGSGH